MNLPTYDEIGEKAEDAKLTAIERFIWEYEPAGIDSSSKWRNMLRDALQEVASGTIQAAPLADFSEPFVTRLIP